MISPIIHSVLFQRLSREIEPSTMHRWPWCVRGGEGSGPVGCATLCHLLCVAVGTGSHRLCASQAKIGDLKAVIFLHLTRHVAGIRQRVRTCACVCALRGMCDASIVLYRLLKSGYVLDCTLNWLACVRVRVCHGIVFVAAEATFLHTAIVTVAIPTSRFRDLRSRWMIGGVCACRYSMPPATSVPS